jgi:hypothetical protein
MCSANEAKVESEVQAVQTTEGNLTIGVVVKLRRGSAGAGYCGKSAVRKISTATRFRQ